MKIPIDAFCKVKCRFLVEQITGIKK